MKVKYMVVKVSKENASIEVCYFLEGTPIGEDGLPTWKYGPFNMDLDVDGDGVPLSGQDLHDALSNACPTDMVMRAWRVYQQQQSPNKALGDVMAFHESLVGKEFDVIPTSPVVMEMDPDNLPPTQHVGPGAKDNLPLEVVRYAKEGKTH